MKKIVLPFDRVEGGPCTGTTTLVERWKDLGNPVVPEPARWFLSLPPHPLWYDHGDYLEVQRRIAALWVTDFFTSHHYRDEVWPRSGNPGDRHLTDGTPRAPLAHALAKGYKSDPLLEHAANFFEYDGQVFLCDPVPYERQPIRPDEKFARKVHEILGNLHADEGTSIISVPNLDSDGTARLELISSSLIA